MTDLSIKYTNTYLQRFKGLQRKTINRELRTNLSIERLRVILKIDSISKTPTHSPKKLRVPKLASFKNGFKSADDHLLQIEGEKSRVIIPVKEINKMTQAYDSSADLIKKLKLQETDCLEQALIAIADARLSPHKPNKSTRPRISVQLNALKVHRYSPDLETDRSIHLLKKYSALFERSQTRSVSVNPKRNILKRKA